MEPKFVHSVPLEILFCLVTILAEAKMFSFRSKTMTLFFSF